MKRHASHILAALVLAGLACATAQAAARPRTLAIVPENSKRWEASLADVKAVLYSAANELWRHVPERELKPIHVAPKGGPIVLFRRGPKGEYYVRLATGKTYWCQYAFQFAHEFCHILCRYEEMERANKWFEESLCEMASLFALRGMAVTWRTHPPYPNWRDFSSALRSYADERTGKSALPEGTTLAQWLRTHEAALRKDSCIRDKNLIVATVLLPLFEKHPEHWQAVQYLNLGARKERRTFPRYLADWHRHAPETHKPFVLHIARLFGIVLAELPPPAPDA